MQMKSFFLFSILFGVWSTWENFKYKLRINVYSFALVLSVFLNFRVQFSRINYYMHSFQFQIQLYNFIV